jgi:hypothetical protein
MADYLLTEPFGHSFRTVLQEGNTMFTKATLGLAVVVATVSGALAATKTHVTAVRDAVHAAYNHPGAYVGTDPDLNVRFELNRDWARGR